MRFGPEVNVRHDASPKFLWFQNNSLAERPVDHEPAAIAWFGLDRIDPIDRGPVSPLNGFLAGILLAFDPAAAIDLNASYRVENDGRGFEFAVHQGSLAAAHGEPAVAVTATAADLVTARLGSTEAKRKSALRRMKFTGDQDSVEALRTVFRLTAAHLLT